MSSATPESGFALTPYDRACAALAEAKRVDDVLDILDTSAAIKAYAKRAKNHDLEADAVELRMRATRRLDELRQAQAETVGLNKGAAAGGTKTGPRGSIVNPRDIRPTLESQGIDKKLAHQGRILGRMTKAAFERKITEVRSSAGRLSPRSARG